MKYQQSHMPLSVAYLTHPRSIQEHQPRYDNSISCKALCQFYRDKQQPQKKETSQIKSRYQSIYLDILLSHIRSLSKIKHYYVQYTSLKEPDQQRTYSRTKGHASVLLVKFYFNCLGQFNITHNCYSTNVQHFCRAILTIDSSYKVSWFLDPN